VGLAKRKNGIANWVPLACFLTLFLLFVVIGLELAPYHMLREVEDENETLKAQLDDRARRREAILRLWQLRSEGVGIRNRHVQPDEEIGWKAEYEAWREQVLTEAQIISPYLEAWLRTLDRMRPAPALSPSASTEHTRKRQIMSEILARMEEFLSAEMLNKDIVSSAYNWTHRLSHRITVSSAGRELAAPLCTPLQEGS